MKTKTNLKMQQAMFLENLWQQMNSVSMSSQKNNILKTAKKYLSSGFVSSEIIELLVNDGYDIETARSCVAMVVSSENNAEPNWGFEIEDQKGDFFNNYDLGLDCIYGSSHDEAMEEAQRVLDLDYSGQYVVTRVFPCKSM